MTAIIGTADDQELQVRFKSPFDPLERYKVDRITVDIFSLSRFKHAEVTGNWRDFRTTLKIPGRVWDYRIPLRLRLNFGPRAKITVQADVMRPTHIELGFVESELPYLRATVKHEETRRKTKNAAPIPGFLLSCPGSGESEPGPGACLTCSTMKLHFEICA